MRVLVIAQYYPPDMGGGATRAFNAVKGLQAAGVSVTVISAVPHYPTGNIPRKYRWKPLNIEYQNGVRVIRTFVPPMKSEGYVKRIILFLSFMLSSLFSIFLTKSVDAIWIANPNILGTFPASLMGYIHRCPLILNIDDLWPESLYDLGVKEDSALGKIGEILAGIAYHRVSALTPISPGYIKTLIEKYGISRDRLHVIRAGVDITKFKNTHIHQTDSHIFKVLYIGAFSPAYNFQQIFDAANDLHRQSDIKIIIQGAGEMAESLKRVMSISRLENVRLIEKIVSREQVAEALSNADALLLPLSGKKSIELGISSKLYEYQAAGKPIICCSSGHPGYYVEETKSGIIVTPGDHMGLAKAILQLKINPALAKTLGENGRNHVEKYLSIDAIGRLILKVVMQYV